MKLTGSRFGKPFGHLGVTIRNQITYTLSPFEQNVTKGIVRKGVPNLVRRVKNKFLMVAIPVFVYYNIYAWAIKTQHQLDRKNPKDYENDV